MLAITVKPIGNLPGLRDLFSSRRIRAATNKIRDAVLTGMANDYLKLVVRAIEEGRAEGPGLSPEWSSQKGHAKPWIDTTDLRNAIVVQRPNPATAMVGIPETAKNRSGERLDLIALILEIGSARIPARPVFEPAARELMNSPRPDWIDKVVVEAFGIA